MISIRKHLQGDKQAEKTLYQVIQTLTEGMLRLPVEGATPESEHLQQQCQHLLNALESSLPPDDLLGLATNVIEALGQRNRLAVEHFRRPVEELKAKVKLLTAAITAVSSTSYETIRRLHQIKGEILASIDNYDVRSMRVRLAECMDNVLLEAERLQAETDRASEQVHSGPGQIVSVAAAGGTPPANDSASGTATRTKGEEIIAQACQEELPFIIVVMVVNQMRSVRQTFGDQVGDMIVGRFFTSIRQQLPAIDQVFRWTGPTVVVVMRQKRTVTSARVAIEALMAKRIACTITTSNDNVQVPISARWTILPPMVSPRLIFHKMDNFIGLG